MKNLSEIEAEEENRLSKGGRIAVSACKCFLLYAFIVEFDWYFSFNPAASHVYIRKKRKVHTILTPDHFLICNANSPSIS